MTILNTEHIKITHNFIVSSEKRANADYDADTFCLPLDANGLVKDDGDIVFYNNPYTSNKAIYHFGDCLSGCLECGSDSLGIDLSSVPGEYRVLLILSHLYQALERGIAFNDGQSEVCIKRIDQPMQCDGDTILTHFLKPCLRLSDTIELCRFVRIGNKWEIVFPENTSVEVGFEEYLKSFDATI